MPRVQCLDCGLVISGRHSRTMEYVFCEACHRFKLHRLESRLPPVLTLASEVLRTENKCKRLSKQAGFLSAVQPQERDDWYGLSDVVLHASDGPGVKAHKVVLAAKSSVFNSLFSVDHSNASSETKKEHIVQMDEVSHEVLKAFVGFFYTATIDPEVLRKRSVTLLGLAEKYGIKLLSNMCQEWITENVTCENAIRSLELAKCYQCKVVKDAVLEMATKRMDQIPDFADYKTYANKDPGLLVELYEGMVKRAAEKSRQKGKDDATGGKAFSTGSVEGTFYHPEDSHSTT